jgi:hypothetical protein
MAALANIRIKNNSWLAGMQASYWYFERAMILKN